MGKLIFKTRTEARKGKRDVESYGVKVKIVKLKSGYVLRYR